MINALFQRVVFASVGTLRPYQPQQFASSSLDPNAIFLQSFAFLGHPDLEGCIPLLAFIWVLSFQEL